MDYLQLSQKKDNEDLEKSKRDFAESLKSIKKENIFEQPKQLSLWKRILKVLNF
jgi:hypothetical protein